MIASPTYEGAARPHGRQACHRMPPHGRGRPMRAAPPGGCPDRGPSRNGTAWRGAGMRTAVMKSRPRWPRTRRMRRIGRSAAHLILGGADGQRVDLRSGRAALRWLPTRSCCPDLTQTNCVASSRGRLRTINEPRTTPRRASGAFNHAPHAACGLFGARWAVRGVPCLRQLRVGGLGRPRQPAARTARPFCSECGPGVSPSPAADVDVG